MQPLPHKSFASFNSQNSSNSSQNQNSHRRIPLNPLNHLNHPSIKRPPRYPQCRMRVNTKCHSTSKSTAAAAASVLSPNIQPDATRFKRMGGTSNQTRWSVVSEEIQTFFKKQVFPSTVENIQLAASEGSFSGSLIDGTPKKGKVSVLFGVYEGDLVDYRPEGSGILRHTLSGQTYKGMFYKGLPHGAGVEYTKTGTIKFRGNWSNGNPVYSSASKPWSGAA